MKKRKYRRIARRLLLLIIAICLMQIGREYFLSVKHGREQEDLNNIMYDHRQENFGIIPGTEGIAAILEAARAKGMAEAEGRTENAAASMEEDADAPEQTPVMQDKFAGLYRMNNDIVGWLSIPGTVIDYPVMQCEDDEYYLHHNFYREKDRYGCLFVKGVADVDTPGTNFIIYGHNMKDGSMFGELDEYGKKAFYEEHSTLKFDTLYEGRTYEIMAVFLSWVYQDDEDVFKYYRFYNADTEEEFNSFYENVMAAALYETGVTAAFGDSFLMLSTCAYHEEDGRLVVVAKRIHAEK